MTSPFEGLKVVELATVLAGPAVGMFFAELGAEVTKIENPKNPDITRSWKLPTETSKTSAYFSAVNFGKRYIEADLKTGQGKAILHNLLAEADILITNFKAGDAEKFSLTFEQLKKQFPRLIVGQISGYKSTPNRKAFDVVLQAETGFMSMNGTPKSGPVKMPVALIDILAAHQLKEGILIALLQREKNGEGSFVEATLEESAISSLANQASNYLMLAHIPQRMGSAHPNIAPYGDTFICADGDYIVLAIGSDIHYLKLLELLDAKEDTTLQSLNSNQKRVANRQQLCAGLQQYISMFSKTELLKTLTKEGIPVGDIKNLAQVFASEGALAMIREEEIGGTQTKRVSSIAFTIS